MKCILVSLKGGPQESSSFVGIVNTSSTISAHLAEVTGTVADIVGTDASFGSSSGVMA